MMALKQILLPCTRSFFGVDAMECIPSSEVQHRLDEFFAERNVFGLTESLTEYNVLVGILWLHQLRSKQ